MPKSRKGLTLPELLITFAVGAIVTGVAAPMLARSRDAYAVRGAKQEIFATFEAARSAGIQRGRPSRLLVQGNTVLAQVDTAPPGQPTVGQFTVRARSPLDTAYRVQLALAVASDTVIQFDARGLANPRLGHTARIRIATRRVVDSVCVSSFGQLLPNGCAP